ncbi:MAG: hypothetical protein ACRCRQ_01200, partial [Metamycoplasmataceae bacterium]
FLDLPEDLKKDYIKKIKKKSKLTQIELEKQALLESFYNGIINGLDNSLGVDIIKNFSIGTIQIDLAIIDKTTRNFIQGFLIDNFSYFNSYEEYVIDRDLKNFLLLKKYPVIKINEMNWVINKGKIIHTINAIVNKKQFSNKQLLADREQV